MGPITHHFSPSFFSYRSHSDLFCIVLQACTPILFVFLSARRCSPIPLSLCLSTSHACLSQ
ncbi:hypothetical protein M407DRAFT_188940 [Tulasnella calospora MUT 4182]|uniref:Uncharacterized protein n=1 Tax=Tulasnella calospora MUT 4182 TaxID=1051891 RepID=A0A0C3K4X6_9AGAM|nr:hypothetical protein M407DRAFT_188940 [Tulasnella calospora MUT 4182]